MVYASVADAISTKQKIDPHLYDHALCFDSMWWEETCNDLWDKGIKDDDLSLIAEMNRNCSVAIKTPVGMTDRFRLQQIDMQGTVLFL